MGKIRLANVTPLEEFFENKAKSWAGTWSGPAYSTALEQVKAAPTVDAVEVVRCKDCKHYMEYPINKVEKRMACYVHLLTPHFMLEDGFCSLGERRTDNGRK
jgi:hypothetical protein